MEGGQRENEGPLGRRLESVVVLDLDGLTVAVLVDWEGPVRVIT